MRWPFFFGRPSAAKSIPQPEPRPPVRDWASLPAIQRALGEPRLTAPTSDFVRSLAGRHDPGLSLAPLGHHVSLQGPSGLVSGIARNVETYSASQELTGRPRLRREPAVQRRSWPSEQTPVGPADESEPTAGPGEPEQEPIRMTFAAIDEPVPVRPPLTRLGDPEANAVLQLAMQRPAQEIAAGPNHASVTGAAAPEIARSATAQRLTLGQARRLGLGAPLPDRGAAAAVQRAVDAAPLDLGPPARSTRSARTDHVEAASQTDLSAVTREGGQSPPAAERIAPIAGALVQRSGSLEAGEVTPPAGIPTAPAAAVVPLETSRTPDRARVQRAVASPLPPLFPRPASAPTAPLVSGRAALLTVRPAPGAEAVASGEAEPVVLQRLPAVTQGEPALTMPPSGIANAAMAAAYGDTAAVETRSTRALPPLAPAPAMVQRVHRASQDFVAYSPFATSPMDTGSPPSATAVGDFPVQREVAGGESSSPQPGGGSAPAVAAAEAPGQSDRELDELARKLHDRISLHLRRDLLIQRERAGMVTDLR